MDILKSLRRGKCSSSDDGSSAWSLAYGSPGRPATSSPSSRKSRNKSKGRQLAKTAPISVGCPSSLDANGCRRGLVGSAKVITMLGPENLDEAIEIISAMDSAARESAGADRSSSSSSESDEESFQALPAAADKQPISSAMPSVLCQTAMTSVLCQTHFAAQPKTLQVIYHDSRADSPRKSSDGLLFDPKTHNTSYRILPENKDSRNNPRTSFASPAPSCDYVNGSADGKNFVLTSLLSPPRRSVYCPTAHRLPTPPPSPNISEKGRPLVLKKLPLPLPTIDTSGRSQRFSPAKACSTSYSSPVQCPRNWIRGKPIGKGSFGIVYEGLNKDDGSFFAVKISDVESTSSDLHQEVNVLSRLSHANIVRYLGSSVDNGQLCIFLELVGMGSLRTILDKYQRFEETMIKVYTRQILNGLNYLHQQNTVHRDIKCANILVGTDGQVKLADFGVAKEINPFLVNSCKGTPQYMAPEMIKPFSENRRYGLEVDIWSLGCTIIEMADGKAPWSDLGGFSFFFKVSQGELPQIPDHLSFEGKDFIRRCLKKEPEERATVSDLMSHPFVANVPSVAVPNYPQQLTTSKQVY